MECDLSEYCIFNNILYQEVDNSQEYKRHDLAKECSYSGTLNIYSNVKQDGIESWIEYDLAFNKGKLTDVYAYDVQTTEDSRDLSCLRPNKPSNRVEITISLSNCDKDKREDFVNKIDDKKLEDIRNILGEPTATIYYPVRASSNSLLGFLYKPLFMTIASVVQTKEDIEAEAKEGAIKIKAPNGDNIILLDEFKLDQFNQQK